MWPMLTIIVLLAVLPSTLAAQDTAAAEEEVQRVTRQYLDARVANDTATLGRILADDFTSINSSGAIGDRSAALRAPTNVTPTGERILAFDVDSLRARVYGSTAVVIGVRRLRRADGSVSAGLRFTFVFVQRGGDWRLVASHTTDIQPPRSPGNGKNGADPAVAAPHGTRARVGTPLGPSVIVSVPSIACVAL